ncbi:MAG: hypothetical protein RLZZ290_593 [Pseudomonadota bacterium]|jgi:PTS system ascorbate-specific IIA component
MNTQSSETLIVLACHAPMASALHAVACHGFGMTLSAIRVLDILSSATPSTVVDALEALWEQEGRPQQVLVLTDLLGATPSNGVNQWLTQDPGTRAGLTGVSLPLLLRALSHREQPARALADRLRASADACISPLPQA